MALLIISRVPNEKYSPRASLYLAAPSSGSEDSEWEEERVARLRERAWRDGPRGPGSGGKGRSRRSREQRTNWRVPAGHERKITAKIRASLAKRRLQQRPGRGPRSAPLQPRKRAEANAKVRGFAGGSNKHRPALRAFPDLGAFQMG
uniref:Uncharacterized protein n=1 Tax=Naja naja TaxID=35670 RepID=A0A8C6Y3C9_NAJNA